MQKLLLVLLPCALILAYSGVTVTSSTPDQIRLSVSLPALQMRTDEVEGRMFTQLYFPEAGISTEIGAPQLPVIREFVEIPFGAKVDVKATVLRNEYIKLEHPVLPLQPPIPKTGPKPD
ncbi:MAG: hypothetical protein N2748_02405, partial [candidate division WOR-3 bacterium]|nr:hypothetical protein [candidate division WOR-3 bacterium]